MGKAIIKQKMCFVVSPIGSVGSPERNHADWLLKGIIEPVFSAHFTDFSVERADKISAPGMIDSQVITCLLDAELVIADMSMLNANAFYEMGIRHMKQKPIIHMFREGDRIPFDVAPYRAIPFTYTHPDDLEAAKLALRSAVTEVIKPDFQVENPVTRARGTVELREHATPEIKFVMDELNAINKRINEMRFPRPSNQGSHFPATPTSLAEIPAVASTALLFTPRDKTKPVEQDAISEIQSFLNMMYGGSTLIAETPSGYVFIIPGRHDATNLAALGNATDFNISEYKLRATTNK